MSWLEQKPKHGARRSCARHVTLALDYGARVPNIPITSWVFSRNRLEHPGID